MTRMKDEATPAGEQHDPSYLAVTDALYRSLLEQFPAVVYVDSNELVSETPYVSPLCEAMLGIPPEEFVADRHLWASRVHPDDLDRVHADWVAAYERQDRFES
jgi:PAS domain-containing protein